MQTTEPRSMRALLIGVLFCISAFFCGSLYAQAGGYPPSQQVFNDPGGAIIGGVRPGDRVQILQLETVFRQGRSERWAYISYGDRYTQATGWVNLDRFRKPSPRSAPTPTAPNTSPYSNAPAQSTTAASIWDIDISCAKDHRRIIRSCELQLVVDIQPTYGADNVVLDCTAELHWTTVNGSQRVSRQQASQPVGASGAAGHHRLALYFNFGDSGAKSAMVENQKCRTEIPAGNNYSPY